MGNKPDHDEPFTRRIVARVPRNLAQAATARSQSTGIPIAEVIRRALRMWIAGELDARWAHYDK